jgi:hypothetical protein
MLQSFLKMRSSALVSIPLSHSLLSVFFLEYQSGITRKQKQIARSLFTLIKHTARAFTKIRQCLAATSQWPLFRWQPHPCDLHNVWHASQMDWNFSAWYQSKLWKDIFRLEVPPTLMLVYHSHLWKCSYYRPLFSLVFIRDLSVLNALSLW